MHATRFVEFAEEIARMPALMPAPASAGSRVPALVDPVAFPPFALGKMAHWALLADQPSVTVALSA